MNRNWGFTFCSHAHPFSCWGSSVYHHRETGRRRCNCLYMWLDPCGECCSPVPVSYTHLDVYKRQAVALAVEGGLPLAHHTQHGIVEDDRDDGQVVADSGAASVSYTHLTDWWKISGNTA